MWLLEPDCGGRRDVVPSWSRKAHQGLSPYKFFNEGRQEVVEAQKSSRRGVAVRQDEAD